MRHIRPLVRCVALILGAVSLIGCAKTGPQAQPASLTVLVKSRAGTVDNVVVWVAPRGPAVASDANTTTLTLDVAEPSPAMHVCGLQDAWQLCNTSSRPLAVFSEDDSGNGVPIGTVAPGGTATAHPRHFGLVRIKVDGRIEPMASVFVVPIPTVADGQARVVSSGSTVTFTNLPPGPARVSAWHFNLPGAGEDVALMPGAVSNATLVVGEDVLPGVP